MWRSSTAFVSLIVLCFAMPASARQNSSQSWSTRDDRIKVTSVALNGVSAVGVGQVKSVMGTTANSRPPWGAKRYFNRRQFEADLKRIQVFYADRGYPDARVASFDLKLNQTQDAITVTIVDLVPARPAPSRR